MSLQNLLEMEDFGRSFSPTDKNADLPKPKPRPRARPSKLLSPKIAKREGNMDDVMSITSGESGNNNSPRKKDSPSQKHARLRPSSKSAFDNVAFVTDEEPVSEASDKRNASRPNPLKRNSLMGSPLAKTLVRQKESYKVSSRDEDSDANGNAGTTATDDDWKYFSSPGRKKGDDDDDDDDSRSDATFTIENEKYKDKGPLSKKPPKPTSSPPVSRIPKPQPNQRKLAKKETIVLPPVERSKKIDIKKKGESETEATPEKKKEEYVAVPIDTEDGDGATDGNNDKKARDESETASVSSSVPAPKDSKKSRFGKFFGSSDNKKNKTPPTKKDKNRSTEEDEKPIEKRSLVNRWRKSAHTFLKTSSKPIDEEAPEEEAKDESKSSKLSPSVSEKHKAKPKSRDSRIIMPESGSENDDIGSSANSDDDDGDINKENISREKVKESKEKPKTDPVDDKPDEIKPTKERFKPFDKLLRSRSKEKQTPSLKSKDDKKENDNLTPEAEKVMKRSKTKFKETASKLIEEQKLDKKTLTKRDKVKTSDSSSSDEHDKDLESNSDMESGTELPVKRLKSPKRKQERKPSEPLQLIDTVSQKELLFGLTIHSSDLLPLDPNVIHPVVKVTAMLQNGQYMKRSNPGERESLAEVKTYHEKKSKHRKRKQSGIMEVTENITESIFPIMSQPCQARHTIPTFAPTWNELLVFEEPFRRFVSRSEPNNSEHDPIILFEVMDFLPMSGNGNSTSVSGFHGSDYGWYKVAWAFLKPIGGNGVMNVNRKLRLQLYKPIKLRRKEKLSGPEVFSWWKRGRREKVNATLYVTPKGIQPPETRTASLRQLLSMRKEHLTQAILDSQLATRKKKEKSKRPSLYELREQANWSRMEGQSCKPPNKLVASLPSSQIESLNIVISGNVHCTKFSPCGYKLAAGLDTDELHVILVFEVPSWTLLKSLTGHHGIIYDIAWKLFELDDYTSYHYMASASADSTVRIWKMDNHQEKTISLFKILYHPSYVYTVKFHPTHPSLLASGCFDGIIRIWDVKPEHSLDLAERKKKSRKKEVKDNQVVTILLDKHNSFVNCLVFDKLGQYLYSGDGSAYLYKWSCVNPSQRKSWKLEKDAKMHHGNVPINSLDLHPSGNRILLHLRDNCIKILDACSFIPLQTLPGLHNERFQIRSCFSPCGNLVLSGSEQNTLCIWDADTGKILQFINPRSYPQCTVTSVDYHPFDYYVVTGLSSAISEPSPVMVYFYNQPSKMNYPMLKKTAMKMRESLEKSRSQSLDMEEGNMSGRARSDMFSAKRGSSTEKFVSIIQKLDSALYLAHQRNKRRETEAKSSTCIAIKKGPEPEVQNIRQPTKKDTVEPNMANQSTPSRRKIMERPRSASSISKEKWDRAKDLTPQRDAKSDSEQPYQLHANDKLTLRKVKPSSRMKAGRSKIAEIGRGTIPVEQPSSSFHFKSTNNKSFDIDSSDY